MWLCVDKIYHCFMPRRELKDRDGKALDYGGPTEIQNAWRLLAGGAEHAAATLIEVSRFGSSEVARNQASMAILDRVGIGAKPEVTVRVLPADVDPSASTDQHVSPSSIVRNRMQQLAAATARVPDDDEVIEAEIVS